MSGRLRCALAALVVGAFAVVPAHAGTNVRDTGTCAAHAPEASRRSGLSIDTLLRVMMAESGDNPRAVSPKGAIGCMQIMPGTWAYLTNRYALGSNPFDARMNMIGGGMYLAELAARYGFPGAYSAYNAGPRRYERYAAGRTRLPAETIAYVGRVGKTGGSTAAGVAVARWEEAALFIVRHAPPEDRRTAAEMAMNETRIPAATLFPLAQDGAPASPDQSGR